jgi:hypothetical protein
VAFLLHFTSFQVAIHLYFKKLVVQGHKLVGIQRNPSWAVPEPGMRIVKKFGFMFEKNGYLDV